MHLSWFVNRHLTSGEEEIVVVKELKLRHWVKMAKRCVFGCLPNKTLFSVPRPRWLRARWLEFLHFKEEGLTVNSRLCSRHFTSESFQNLTQYEMGFAKVLYLKNTAVPSVYTVGAPQSMKVSVSRWLYHHHHNAYHKC